MLLDLLRKKTLVLYYIIGRFCSYPWLLYILSMHKSWLWLLNTFHFGPVNLRGKLIFACAWQRWLLRIPVSAYVSCHGSFPLCQFPLCQFPFDQCWHGGNWQSGKVHHFITSNHCYRSVNFLVYIKPNVRRWQNCMMPLGVSIVSNTRRDWLQGRMDLKSPWGGLPSSGHWAKLSNRLVPFATVGN